VGDNLLFIIASGLKTPLPHGYKHRRYLLFFSQDSLIACPDGQFDPIKIFHERYDEFPG
jgi:hypothetical protein